MKRRSIARLVAASCVSTLVATACLVPTVSGAATSGKKLVVLTPTVAPGLNPTGPTTSTASQVEALDNLFGTLLYFKPKKTAGGIVIPTYGSFQSRLATSWSHTGTTWTFHLRKGVKSCAGNTFTAQDVVYTFQRAMSLSGAAPVAWFLGNVSGFLPTTPVLPTATASTKVLKTEVVAVNTYTVKFKLSHPDALFPTVLAIGYLGIFTAKAMKAHATASTPWAQKYTNSGGAAGVGPYCLSQWSSGRSITYAANKGYYMKPHFSTVVDTAVPEDANRVAAIESGSAQIVTGLTAQEYASIAKSHKANVLSWQSNQNIILELNYDTAPWNIPGPKNALLRQAIADAIPYQQIIKSVFHGKAQQMLSLVPPGYTGYKAFHTYSYNPSKAKQLLAQAGYPNGAGLSGPGLQLSYVSTNASVLQPIATIVRTALASVGINLTLNPITASQFDTQELTKRSLPLAMDANEHPIGPDADYTAQLYFVSTAKGGLNNMTNYSNATVDSLWKQALGMPNGATRNTVLAKLQQTLMATLPWIPLVMVPSEIAVAKGITNWIGNPDTTVAYWGLK